MIEKVDASASKETKTMLSHAFPRGPTCGTAKGDWKE